MIEVTGIRVVDLSQTPLDSFKKHVADCVILTHDNRLLMQQRPENWGSSAGCLTTFGGHIEEGETVVEGLVRELNEETGAVLDACELIPLAILSEDFTGHTEAVHVYFWHDKNATVTGCYEAEDRRYNSVKEALAHPKIMDYVRWALLNAQDQGLLNALEPNKAKPVAPTCG